jgi:hypothetical protein
MLFDFIEKKQVVLPAKEDALAVIALIEDVVKMALFEVHSLCCSIDGVNACFVKDSPRQ